VSRGPPREQLTELAIVLRAVTRYIPSQRAALGGPCGAVFRLRDGRGAGEGEMVATTSTGEHGAGSAGMLGHPTGLFPLFLVETWERFSRVVNAWSGLLARLRRAPPVPLTFALGLVQVGLGSLAFWPGCRRAPHPVRPGAETADARGMVWLGGLLLGYLLHATWELCVSPVGWGLAAACSTCLAGFIATLTGPGGRGDGGVPLPRDTLTPYADVFFTIGLAASVSALVLLALSPLLVRWMHREERPV
jgi:dipeptide/tripeptide permease